MKPGIGFLNRNRFVGACASPLNVAFRLMKPPRHLVDCERLERSIRAEERDRFPWSVPQLVEHPACIFLRNHSVSHGPALTLREGRDSQRRSPRAAPVTVATGPPPTLHVVVNVPVSGRRAAAEGDRTTTEQFTEVKLRFNRTIDRAIVRGQRRSAPVKDGVSARCGVRRVIAPRSEWALGSSTRRLPDVRSAPTHAAGAPITQRAAALSESVLERVAARPPPLSRSGKQSTIKRAPRKATQTDSSVLDCCATS